MSITYADLIHTRFPDSCDSYEYMSDMTFELLGLVSQYESLIINKRFDEANQLLKNNPQLNRIYFNAEKYNKIVDSVKAIQRLYFSDIQKYLEQIITFKGNYVSTVTYQKYDMVLYNYSAYLCVSENHKMGILPTDSNIFVQITLQGERGESGWGLAYVGTWQANKVYSQHDCVTYNNVLYASVINDNVAKTPSQNSSYWTVVVDFNLLNVYDNSSSGLNSTNFQDAINELNVGINNNKNNINNNTNSINTMSAKLNTVEQGAQKNTVTGVKGSLETNYRTGNINISKANIGLANVDNTADVNKSVNYANSSGTCTTANYSHNAGNSDMVDGFHFQISTTDLSPGTSVLTTNVFYFVYE